MPHFLQRLMILFAVSFALPGCFEAGQFAGPSIDEQVGETVDSVEEFELIFDEAAALMDETARVLKSIRDASSLETARPQIENLNARWLLLKPNFEKPSGPNFNVKENMPMANPFTWENYIKAIMAASPKIKAIPGGQDLMNTIEVGDFGSWR